jgi:hypothetical protein
MVCVTTVTNPMTARILAAQLGSEGIVWELRGTDGLYPVGPVELLVEEGDLAAAREVLGQAADDEVEWQARGRSSRRGRWAIAALLLAVLVGATRARLVDAAL